MLPAIRDALAGTTEFRAVVEQLNSGAEDILVDGSGASSLSFLVAEVAEEEARPILLVIPRPEDAELFADELEGMLGPEQVRLLPSTELLPYEKHSPVLEITAARMSALQFLRDKTPGVVVAPARALLAKTLPRSSFEESIVTIAPGTEIDLDQFCEHLIHIGYKRDPVADCRGVFARRGGVLDIFPAERNAPVRVELFGDEVESIREFDPESQRSSSVLKTVTLVPQSEVPLTDAAVGRVIERELPGHVGALLDRGAHFDGIERYLPLFHPGAETPLDYLADDGIVVLLEERDLYHAATEVWSEAVAFHEEEESDEYLPEPTEAFADARAIEKSVGRFTRIRARRGSGAPREGAIDLAARPSPPFLGDVELLKSELENLLTHNFRVYVLCDNRGQEERIRELLEPWLDRIGIGLGRLRRGFLLPREQIAVFAEHEIFHRARRERLERRRPRGAAIDSYLALRPGDFIVHIDHGVGRFGKVESLTVDGITRDCVVLEYAAGDKLYVPTDRMGLLQKYTGSESATPAVDKIGGTSWAKTKAKAKRAVREMATELLKLYAARKSRPGFAFSDDGRWQRELEDSFLYDETDHQIETIRDVKRDMQSPRPMDRLVCGDVGYGKTEVAVRAAFKAVVDGKQVAVLSPTTILAQQHHRTFSDRFGPFPVRVEVLSRFRRPADIKKIRDDLETGAVDVIIGTHRILSKDIRFKDLGLLIVDEEQRFGVAQKEKLKKLRETVDVLTLTATPIPRTLHMSLAGARDMSIINTPPKDRHPIATEIIDFDREVISAAILRELDRGGQVFFVHNRVQSIQSMAALVSRLVPEARVGIAHGQMTGSRLESVMFDFIERKIDVLVSTMIIESGLDIPSVNTLIVNRADRFGLAQLYQLRGRVGRSSHRAYTYLIVPREKTLSDEADKRLEALVEFTDLGSGYRIARKDLEIRGAGNLLGAEQHGFVTSIGFELYCKLLEDAVRKLKGEEVVVRGDTKVEADFDSYLADDYIGDPDLKVILYRRLAETNTSEEVSAIRDEVGDRFGKPPREAENLFSLRELKIIGDGCEAETIRLDKNRVRVKAGPDARLDRKRLEGLIGEIEGNVSFEADRGVLVEVTLAGSDEPFEVTRKVLAALGGF